MKQLAEFFAFARERYEIKLRRDRGEHPPWTKDPVLRTYRFCNVFREDDRVTRWFRDNIRQPLCQAPDVLLATIAFRWFNFVPSGEALKPMLLRGEWNLAEARRLLREVRARFGQVVTGAFMVHSPNGIGLDKIDGLTQRIAEFAEQKNLLHGKIRTGCSLEAAHQAILDARVDSMGRFMAYEVVTDLRWTSLLSRAGDIFHWASAGPGAARGLAWVIRGDLGEVQSYGSARAQTEMNAQMREILAASKDEDHWPGAWPFWEMREVEHSLCEYDKHQRAAKLGERLKRRFTPC